MKLEGKSRPSYIVHNAKRTVSVANIQQIELTYENEMCRSWQA